MGRMLELIREGKAPASMVRRAVRGELALPAAEAIEILALLAADCEWRAEAEQTLEGWDEAELIELASGPGTPASVLRCLLRTQGARPAVIASLRGNSALSLDEATQPEPEPVAVAADDDAGEVEERLRLHPGELHRDGDTRDGGTRDGGTRDGGTPEVHTHEFHPHQPAELADEEDRPFELVTDAESEADPMAELLKRVKSGASEIAVKAEEKEQLSLLQRIAHMRVGERIKLATRGGREERMILIRDRSKLVSLAVLASPKVDATEMETFAAMKNVQESVLRAIASNRKNLKNYGVIRTLVTNPKSPLDVSLPLLAHLLIKDLRSLALNKNVNETIRKRATGMYRVKTEKKKE